VRTWTPGEVLTHAIACGVVLAPLSFRDLPFVRVGQAI
jgi:hypothetical protein